MEQEIQQSEDEIQKDKIIEQLEGLNEKLRKEATFKYIFSKGIVYGVGFFVGSAILATIALGILGPILGKISWVGDNFERGVTILKPTQ